jgi:hypothetical protein
MSAQNFTHDELEKIRDRAESLAHDEADPSVRTALQLLGEAAANLAVKVSGQEFAESRDS